jgi:hypothetical protein
MSAPSVNMPLQLVGRWITREWLARFGFLVRCRSSKPIVLALEVVRSLVDPLVAKVGHCHPFGEFDRT